MAQLLEQSVASLRKIQEYVTNGLTIMPVYTVDYIEVSEGTVAEKIAEYRALHKDYINLNEEIACLTKAAKDSKKMLEDGKLTTEQIEAHFSKIFDNQLAKFDISHSGLLQEFEQKVAYAAKGQYCPGTNTAAALDDADEELAMTESTISLKCPYTGKDMENPVKNINCGHSYDKEGILAYIKQRGHRARCPVSGCANQTPLNPKVLVPDKILMKEIEKQQSQKR